MFSLLPSTPLMLSAFTPISPLLGNLLSALFKGFCSLTVFKIWVICLAQWHLPFPVSHLKVSGCQSTGCLQSRAQHRHCVDYTRQTLKVKRAMVFAEWSEFRGCLTRNILMKDLSFLQPAVLCLLLEKSSNPSPDRAPLSDHWTKRHACFQLLWLDKKQQS